MVWNYRIIKTEHGFGVHEVYYNGNRPDDNQICGWVVLLCEESVQELKDSLLSTTKAFGKTVLNETWLLENCVDFEI